MRALPGVPIVRVGLALAFILFALALRVPTLSQPLLEAHGFRQTYTAYTALVFHEEGIDLLRPKVPLGLTNVVPLEFPLFQALGATVMGLGVAPDTAMRVSGLLCFALSAMFLGLLVRHVAGPVAAAVAVFVFVFSPFGLLWSRTSLGEYLTTAGAVGATWAAIAWRDGDRPILYAGALVLSVLAILLKPTTALFWLVPAFFYIAPQDRAGWRGWLAVRRRPAMIALFALPVVIGALWTVYADSVKAQDFGSAFQTSGVLRPIIFGVPEQRFDIDQWRTILGRAKDYIVGTALIPVLALGVWAAIRGQRRWFWAGLAVAIVFPVLTFFDFYVVHDYYLAAVSPAIAAFVGLGGAWLIARARGRAHLVATLGALLLGVLATFGDAGPYWSRMYGGTVDPFGVLPRARELAAVTRPDDRVIVLGSSYDPEVLYYARRKGQLLLPHHDDGSGYIESLATKGYEIVSVWEPGQDPIRIARNWAWSGALNARTYVVGAAPGDMRSAGVMSSDDTELFARLAAGVQTLSGPVALSCNDRGADIPAGPNGTWIRVAKGAHPDTILQIGSSLAPLPLRAVFFVTPAYAAEAGGRRIPIRCSKGEVVIIESVIAAGTP